MGRQFRLSLILAISSALLLLSTAIKVPSIAAAAAPAPAIDLSAVKSHLAKLQEVATANGGNRAHGRPGHQASVDYFKAQLEAAGFTITVQEVRFWNFAGFNLIADWPGGDPDRVLMVGSHLDSVVRGPGINDNGSGAAALLEVAKAVAATRFTPATHLRFAWWTAEELALEGSISYVSGLSEAERAKIKAYLNFDMIASPNPGYFVYDGDDSAHSGAGPGPAGSAEIENVFRDYFAGIGVSMEDKDFDGRSDYVQFIKAGIPAGGTFSGSDKVKSTEQAAKWGGTVGMKFDPCYHQACDTSANIDDVALGRNTGAIAHAVWTLAQRTG
jgi:aminopeptidase S